MGLSSPQFQCHKFWISLIRFLAWEVAFRVHDEDESNYISVASNQLRRNEQAHLTVPN